MDGVVIVSILVLNISVNQEKQHAMLEMDLGIRVTI